MKIRRYNKSVSRKTKIYRIDRIINITPMALFCKLFFTIEP